ncbi:MAG: hypothetical protein KDK66_00705 [Deltaproteobacteria bacterium]|nr:hypothetical protein [Deltaproteobacteria bacterium]
MEKYKKILLYPLLLGVLSLTGSLFFFSSAQAWGGNENRSSNGGSNAIRLGSMGNFYLGFSQNPNQSLKIKVYCQQSEETQSYDFSFEGSELFFMIFGEEGEKKVYGKFSHPEENLVIFEPSVLGDTFSALANRLPIFMDPDLSINWLECPVSRVEFRGDHLDFGYRNSTQKYPLPVREDIVFYQRSTRHNTMPYGNYLPIIINRSAGLGPQMALNTSVGGNDTPPEQPQPLPPEEPAPPEKLPPTEEPGQVQEPAPSTTGEEDLFIEEAPPPPQNSEEDEAQTQSQFSKVTPKGSLDCSLKSGGMQSSLAGFYYWLLPLLGLISLRRFLTKN